MAHHRIGMARPHHRHGTLALATGILTLASSLMSGCAAPEPPRASTTTAQQEPGTMKVHMGGQIGVYGTVSSKTR